MESINTFEQKFNISRLLKFSIPSIIMMFVLSMYQCVDGLFVSNFVNTNAIGAINIVYPFIFIGLGISLMLGTGGSALIGKALGESDKDKANSLFTFLIFVSLLFSVITGIIGTIFIDELVVFLGATDIYFDMAKTYLQTHFYFISFYYLQNIFQILFITASKPKIGLVTTVLAGVTNIVLDYLFIVVFKLGILGASIATGLSFLIPSITGIVYFLLNKKSLIRFSNFKIDLKSLWNVIVNGSSEMLANIANSVTTFLFNYQFYKYYLDTGVDSITIVLYFQFFVSSIMYGFASGIAPIISYKFGKQEKEAIISIKRRSIVIISLLSIISFIASILLISPVALLFSGCSVEVYNLTISNFIYFALSLLFMGISIFASSYFTALNDGVSSLIISTLRTLVFLSISLIVLPELFNEFGLWFATSFAELLGAIVSIVFVVVKKIKFKPISEQ